MPSNLIVTPNRSLRLSYLFSAEIKQVKIVEFREIICDRRLTFVFNLQVPANHYEISQKVEAGNHGKIVAIDLETGDFEIDAREIAACNRLESRHPDTQIWIVRVGSRHVRRFGGHSKRAL